jgi:uncharacterized protein YybS (DUF2232 family)
MLKNQASYLTYGAGIIVLFSILLAVSLYVPFVGFITSFIVPLPIAWYSAKFDRKQAVWVMVIGIVISFIGGVFGVLFALIVAPLGFIIGASIRSKKTKLYMLMTSGIFILLMIALQYVISIWVLNINVLEQLLGAAEISYKQAGNIMSSVGQLPKDYDSLVEQTLLIAKMTMPAYFIVIIFITAFIYLVINLGLLKRLKLEVPKFSKFTDFRLPKAVLWYYLFVSFFSLFVSYEVGSFGYLATINALLILRVLLFLQGVSFIHYYIHVLGYPKWLAVVLTFLAVPLYTFTIILGVFDLGFNLRSYLKGRHKK